MIVVVEPNWDGTNHAPGNSHLVQMVAHGFPESPVRVHGGARHLEELRSFPALAAMAPRVSLHPEALFPDPGLYGKTHIVSLPRFRHELALIRRALDAAPGDGPVLLLLASATSTAVLAARLAARLSRRRVAVQVGLHGNLNDMEGWRPRNPLLRALDLRATLARPLGDLRYLTFEGAIAREAARALPALAGRVDSVPLAVNTSELGGWEPRPVGAPVRVGLVGLATEAKGITPFLETARRIHGRLPGRAEFVLVGTAPGDDDPPDQGRFRDLVHPVRGGYLPRAEFLQRLRSLDYVFLPLQPVYYRLSPSGALLDALTWLKPVLATRVPIAEDLFAEAGEIGVLRDDVGGLQEALEGLILRPDPERHARWVENLRRARAGRAPKALGPRYRRIVEEGFPGLFAAAA